MAIVEQTTEAAMAQEIFVIYQKDSRIKSKPGAKLVMRVFRACFAHVAHKHDIYFHRGKEPLSPQQYEDRVVYNMYLRLTSSLVSKRIQDEVVKEAPLFHESTARKKRSKKPATTPPVPAQPKSLSQLQGLPQQLRLFGPLDDFHLWCRHFKGGLPATPPGKR